MKTYCWDILELSWRSLKLQTLIKGSWDSVVFPSRWWIKNLSLVEFKGFIFFRKKEMFCSNNKIRHLKLIYFICSYCCSFILNLALLFIMLLKSNYGHQSFTTLSAFLITSYIKIMNGLYQPEIKINWL